MTQSRAPLPQYPITDICTHGKEVVSVTPSNQFVQKAPVVRTGRPLSVEASYKKTSPLFQGEVGMDRIRTMPAAPPGKAKPRERHFKECKRWKGKIHRLWEHLGQKEARGTGPPHPESRRGRPYNKGETEQCGRQRTNGQRRLHPGCLLSSEGDGCRASQGRSPEQGLRAARGSLMLSYWFLHRLWYISLRFTGPLQGTAAVTVCGFSYGLFFCWSVFFTASGFFTLSCSVDIQGMP